MADRVGNWPADRLFTATADDHGIIRTIQFRRRRSRVPWIYAVYHVRRHARRARRRAWLDPTEW
ncbi:MAG TPA: hypothetical protein VFJ02_19940 [Vicinamibacterales bacterium]|nr:hypothetical protein [Vicinamibacterales bacterium]